MHKLFSMVIALCFLFEPIYFITRGVVEPTSPRLEEQPIIFSILLALSGIFSAIVYFFQERFTLQPIDVSA